MLVKEHMPQCNHDLNVQLRKQHETEILLFAQFLPSRTQLCLVVDRLYHTQLGTRLGGGGEGEREKGGGRSEGGGESGGGGGGGGGGEGRMEGCILTYGRCAYVQK